MLMKFIESLREENHGDSMEQECLDTGYSDHQCYSYQIGGL